MSVAVLNNQVIYVAFTFNMSSSLSACIMIFQWGCRSPIYDPGEKKTLNDIQQINASKFNSEQ